MATTTLSNTFSPNAQVNTAICTFLRTFESENDVRTRDHQLEDNVTKLENNFCSIISRLNFQYDENGINVRKSVLLKIPFLAPNYDHLKTTNIFEKEVYVYETVLPRIYDLWPKDYFTPTVYSGIPESGILIMEDLGKEGFRTIDAHRQLDSDHCTIALQTLAEFHAVSFKYLQNVNDLPDFICRGAELGSSFRKQIDSLYDRFLQIVSTSVSPSTVEKLQELKKNFWTNAKTVLLPDATGLNVLLHGDFWTGNILFKHDQNYRVCCSKLIDWQNCHVGSPAVDLINFFSLSPQFIVFETERDTLTDSYLAKLNETLAKLGCDFIYTREKLNTDMDRYKFLYVSSISCILQFLFEDMKVLGKELTKSFSKMYESLALKWLAFFEAQNIL